MTVLLRRTAAVLALAGALAACDSPTDGDGESPLPVAAGTVVQGQVTAGRAMEYTMSLDAAEFRLLLQARSGSAADTLIAEVVSLSGGPAVQVRSIGTDTAIAEQASAWVASSAGVTWRIRVRGQGADDGGAYSLLVFPRNSAPETIPAAITLGKLVEGEALDVPGDVDEFTFQGTAGQEVVMFAQSPRTVRAELVDRATGHIVGSTTTHKRDAALEENSSGRVPLPRTGEYVVRVTWGNPGRTPYRLRVDAVNRAPENGAPALSPGAVAAEAIGSVGDVDEFSFSAVAGQEINLMLQLQTGMSGGVTLELLRGTERIARLESNTPAPSLDDRGTGRITLTSGGAYTVRVYGPAVGTPESATGTYRFEIYPVDRRPEAGGRLVLDGHGTADAVDRPGDVDDFTFAGTAGQLVVIHAGGPTPSRGNIAARLFDPAGNPVHVEAVVTGNGTAYALRHALRVTGTYRVQVAGQHVGSMASGAYTVGAYTVSAAPEHVPATLRVGQTVTAERIDRPGDLDVFTVEADPGREVALFLGAEAGRGALGASMRPTSASNGPAFVFSGSPALDERSTGSLKLEPGPYTVVVDPQMVSQTTYFEGGAYGFRLFAINRAPEGRPAAYTLGEMVEGEPVYPAVDVDEYTFEVRETTPLRIEWQVSHSEDGVFVLGVLRDERTGLDVWNTYMNYNGPVRQITLPAGRYRMSVSVTTLNAGHRPPVPSVSYRFAFIP